MALSMTEPNRAVYLLIEMTQREKKRLMQDIERVVTGMGGDVLKYLHSEEGSECTVGVTVLCRSMVTSHVNSQGKQIMWFVLD